MKRMRLAANLTQAALSARIQRPQSFVAKYEGGERRIDVIEFVEIAEAIGFDPVAFIEEFTKSVQVGGKRLAGGVDPARHDRGGE